MASIHRTVLLHETIEGLNLPEHPLVIDATFGGGGHSADICRRFSGARIIALDADTGAWDRAKEKFENLDCDIRFVNENFKNLRQIGDVAPDGIIFDLGLSSDQLEKSGRGFSFIRNEPLLMTMKENPSSEDLSAHDIVNLWSEATLADILYGYGEERYARRIAGAMTEARKKKAIETTFDLVKIVEQAVPRGYRKGRIHFATRTFQALRIATNDELGALREGLAAGFEMLRPGGRIAVITFHSLEDRIVKKFFREKKTEGKGSPVNKKPIVPSEKEVRENPRARSAKLRIFEKN